MIYARRLSEHAAALATREADPARRAELEEIARVNARVPAHAPETFHEAIQAVWTIESLLVADVAVAQRHPGALAGQGPGGPEIQGTLPAAPVAHPRDASGMSSSYRARGARM